MGKSSTLFFAILAALTACGTEADDFDDDFEADADGDESDDIDFNEVSQEIATTGLQGAWRFDEKMGTTAFDSSGNVRDATLSAGATFQLKAGDNPPIAKNKSGMKFGGALNSIVTVPTAGVFTFAAPTSLSAWIKTNGNNDITIAGVRGANCNRVRWKFGYNNTDGLYYQAGGTRGKRVSSIRLTTGVWTHVGVARSATGLTFFKDGVQVATTRRPGSPNLNNPMTFGRLPGCTGAGFEMDQVRYYSRALTATEWGVLGTPPAAPTNVTVANLCANTQRITWDAMPGSTLYYSYKGTAAGNEVFATSVLPNTLTGQNLLPSTQYSWAIRNEVDELYSLPTSSGPLTTLPPPDAPSNVASTLVNSTRFQVTWAPVPRAVVYRIFTSTDGVNYVQRAAVLATSPLSATVANLIPGTTYFIKMTAADCGTVVSADSAVITQALSL